MSGLGLRSAGAGAMIIRPRDRKLELDTRPSSIVQAAAKAARGASAGVDGLTVSMAKGATAQRADCRYTEKR